MFSYLVASRGATRSDHLTDSLPLCLDTPRPEHTSGTCQSTEWKLTRRTGSAGYVASDGSRHCWSSAVGNTHSYADDTSNDVSFPRDASTVAPAMSDTREAGRPRHAWTPPAPGYRDNSERTSVNYRQPGREPARDGRANRSHQAAWRPSPVLNQLEDCHYAHDRHTRAQRHIGHVVCCRSSSMLSQESIQDRNGSRRTTRITGSPTSRDA